MICCRAWVGGHLEVPGGRPKRVREDGSEGLGLGVSAQQSIKEVVRKVQHADLDNADQFQESAI